MDVDKIYIQLIKLGFNKKRIGTLYIAEATVYFIENPECEYLTKGVYRFLARKHHKKVDAIKSNMIHACIDASRKSKQDITVKRTIKVLINYNKKSKKT